MSEQQIQRMQEIVETYVHDQEFMGTVLVAKNTDILLHQGYGQANIEWNISNTPKTKFRLGSLTKQFTAAAILLLEERGLLKTEDSITILLPNAPSAWKNIKIFHLLNHTHGIPNYTQFPEFREMTTFKRTPWEQIQIFIDKPLDFGPGTKYYYNNSGYVVLGFLIEHLTGQSYARFIRDNIFIPLNMQDSGYDSFMEIIPNRAAGYSKDPNGQWSNAEYLDMSLPYAAGSLYSTTEDLLKWTEHLFNFKLLPADSVRKMTTPFMEHYGFGVEVKEINKIQVIMHIGGINGFHTALIYAPSSKTTIAVVSNLNTFGYVWDIGFLAQNIALKLLSVVHGVKVQLPAERRSIMVAPKVLEQYIGEYEIKPNLKLVIFIDNGQLKASFSNQRVISLHAETESGFYSLMPDLSFKFLKNKVGGVTQIHLSQSGYELTGTKI
jgi:CubicO group peptidase (beta-lactamase class C family)